MLQSAGYIQKSGKEVRGYIKELSNLVDRDEKLQRIVSKNIEYLSEESQHILKIVCLGYSENILFDLLYKVFSFKYPDTTHVDFLNHLNEVVRLNILSYDNKKELLKIHRVIHQASTLQLSASIDDELIRSYSKYLKANYNPKRDIYPREKAEQTKYLTLHSVTFLTKYLSKILSSRDVLLLSLIAKGYAECLLDNSNSSNYIQFAEELLRDQIEVPVSASVENDTTLASVYSNLGEVYYCMEDYKRSEEYHIKSLKIREDALPEDNPDLALTYYEYTSV